MQRQKVSWSIVGIKSMKTWRIGINKRERKLDQRERGSRREAPS